MRKRRNKLAAAKPEFNFYVYFNVGDFGYIISSTKQSTQANTLIKIGGVPDRTLATLLVESHRQMAKTKGGEISYISPSAADVFEEDEDDDDAEIIVESGRGLAGMGAGSIAKSSGSPLSNKSNADLKKL